MKYMLALTALVAPLAFAQPYVGARALQSTQQPNGTGHDCGYSTYASCNDHLRTLNLYGGYAFGHWALEAGGGPLGKRVSHNVSPTYDIVQNIQTKHVYLAGVRNFGPFHALLGLSRVSMKNHEYGWNSAGPNQDQLNYSTTTQPIFGGGAHLKLTDSVSARFDIFRINHVARSHWTGSSNITAFAIGLQLAL
jgi:hypothetical protein